MTRDVTDDGADSGSGIRRRRRDISAVLAARILEYIAARGLPADTHIAAQDLADRFTVSRSPVNQALKLLSEKGVVTHRPNQGYFVSDRVPSGPEQVGLSAADDLAEVYFRIAEDRLSGRLGEQVSERLLRETYDLTRGQLAELLNRIGREGWAERRPGYGWTFSPVLTTPEALEQTYRLRIAVEPAAILDPGFRLDPAAAAECRAVETWLLSGAIETVSPDRLYERGVRFHEMIAQASNNPFFLEVLRRVNRVRRLLVYRSMNDRRRYYGQARDHLELLDLLEAGRNEEASAAMRRHLEQVVQNHRQIERLFDR
jgi:DNA-binding GntR family transcriptional regulator